jgi:hypothetical protein
VTFNGTCNMEEQPKTADADNADREHQQEEIAQMKVVEGG